MEWCGEPVTRYKDANQQYSKDNNSKVHSRKKNINQVYKDFQGSSIIHRSQTLELQEQNSLGPPMFNTKDYTAERILLSSKAQKTKGLILSSLQCLAPNFGRLRAKSV
jgi:hypothetical protein